MLALVMLFPSVPVDAQRRARVLIESDPPGATVYVGDEPIGETPVSVRRRRGRSVEVVLRLHGYEEARQNVRVTRNRTVRIELVPSLQEEGVEAPPPVVEETPADAVQPATEETAEDETSADVAEGADADASAEPTPEPEEAPVTSFSISGIYRFRYAYVKNVPVPRSDPAMPDEARTASFGFMSLRLQPRGAIRLDANLEVSLNARVYVLDNVMWGDNARVFPIPELSFETSTVDVFGDEVPLIRIPHLWVEIAHPAFTFHAGRRDAELAVTRDSLLSRWADPLGVRSALDGVLLDLRPVTAWEMLNGGSSDPHPLTIVPEYYIVSEDTLGTSLVPDPRDPALELVTRPADDVHHLGISVRWLDETVLLGALYIRRLRRLTDTDIHASSWFAIWAPSLGESGPRLRLRTAGLVIWGETYGLPRAGFDPATGRTPDPSVFDFLGMLASAKLSWDALELFVELGYGKGDPNPGDAEIESFGLGSSHAVGMLLFDWLMAGRRGRIFGGPVNTWYVYPEAVWRVGGGFELAAAGVLAWVDALEPIFVQRPDGDTDCGPFGDGCLLGWEVDLGAHYIREVEGKKLWLALEVGVAGAGSAVAERLEAETLFTAQSRLGIAF